MVEFRFDIKPLFPQSIVRVTSSLLPHTFRGDRRQALDVTSKMTEIIDELGQLSAVSQKLTKPVTSAQRLRKNDNQVIYLLADVNEGRNGKVLGLLKVGKKDLYLFDEAGNSRKIEHTPCILDFYVHESRQRSGLGKHMFETMLTEEKWLPVKCSVDRPSDKLLGFLKKHYGLERIIPQANNFVLYDGFFQDESISQKYTGNREQANIMHITNSPNTQLFGAHYTANESLTRESRKLDNGGIITLKSQIIQQQNKQQNAPNGRYGAPRPHCSMAEKNSGSEASMSPSQAADQGKNSRKNPLDALSRSVKSSALQRRSGLQDVDEDYLQNNVFAIQEQRKMQRAHAAATALSTAMQSNDQRAEPQSISALINQPAAGAYQQHHPQQHYQQAVVNQQQPQQVQQQQQQQVQQQQQQQPPQQNVAPQYNYAQQGAVAAAAVQQPPAIIANTQTLTERRLQTPRTRRPAGEYVEAAPTGSGEPDLCATCPNCQTTLYLIIHSGAVPVKRDAQTGRIHHDTVDLIGQNFAEMAEKMQQVHVSEQYYREHENDQKPEIASIINDESNVENEPPQEEFSEPQMHEDLETNKHSEQDQNNHYAKGVDNDNIGCVRKPTTFTLSKQHTGMKNRSFGVGMAVTPTQNMEFNQGDREDFNMINIHRPIGSKLNSPPGDAQTDINDAMSTTSSGGEGLTEQGYHDLKFFHNRLW